MAAGPPRSEASEGTTRHASVSGPARAWTLLSKPQSGLLCYRHPRKLIHVLPLQGSCGNFTLSMSQQHLKPPSGFPACKAETKTYQMAVPRALHPPAPPDSGPHTGTILPTMWDTLPNPSFSSQHRTHANTHALTHTHASPGTECPVAEGHCSQPSPHGGVDSISRYLELPICPGRKIGE